MYRDNTLIPTEALRLAALGLLAEGEHRYDELAREVRFFVARIAGPSLDLLGSSLELLHYEGLAAPVDGGDIAPDTVLRITDDGRRAFETLMTGHVRAPVNDVSKLVIALKLRFLKLLPEDARAEQADMLIEMCETELARLTELRDAQGAGVLDDWLDLELRHLRENLAWFRAL